MDLYHMSKNLDRLTEISQPLKPVTGVKSAKQPPPPGPPSLTHVGGEGVGMMHCPAGIT